MLGLKDKLKKQSGMVELYEFVFGRLHRMRRRFFRELKFLKTKLTVKTKYNFGKKNTDKTFFIITCNGKEMGLYSIILYMLPFLEYADRKKYIPIIDLKKSGLPSIQDTEKISLENAWEYYYEQPVDCYTLEEVYQSKHVIVMKDGAFRIKMPAWNAMFPMEDHELDRWNKILMTYVRLNAGMSSRVEEERARIFKPGYKVLGVGIRAGLRAGMLRNEKLFNAHPVQPTCEELLSIIEDKMKRWSCDAIFLSCDDREYTDKFISYFGEVCYHVERRLKHYFRDDRPVMEASERFVELNTGSIRTHVEEYIAEVYLLAECNCLYSCIGGGSQFAYLMNGGRYEHLEVYDKGLYEGLG